MDRRKFGSLPAETIGLFGATAADMTADRREIAMSRGIMVELRADVDIARDLRSIEWLKTELLAHVARLFQGMHEGGDEVISDRLASVILSSYILGRRLGIDFGRLDLKLKHKVRANAQDPHDFEQWYGDFTALAKYFDSRER